MRSRSRSQAPARGLLLAVALIAVSGATGLPPARAQTACDFAPEVRVTFTPVAAGVGVTSHTLVTAEDPNGDLITALTVDLSGLPPGNDAVFTPNASNTAGELTWTPQAGQAGTYSVAFIASNALSDTASAAIVVTDSGGAPFVQAPATVIAHYFEPTSFLVYAGDPDGDAISSLTASGLPFGATFTANASNTEGTFSWTPDLASGGGYSVAFTASNALRASATTFVQVPQVDRPPVVVAPPSATGTEGSLLTICARAFDPDGDAITSFTVSPQPPGVQVEVQPPGEVLTLRWTPAVGQAGTYQFQFVASNALSGSATVSVTILPASGDRPPVVSAPGSAATDTGSPLTVAVTASDPDGDAISSLTASPVPQGASFTAGAGNTSGTLAWTPAGTQAGTYFVVFTAENDLAGSATTVIQVNQPFSCYAFATGGNKSIRLGSNRPTWCANIEPVAGTFEITDIDVRTIVLISAGTGSVDEIKAETSKIAVVGDQNHNDVPDLAVCFLKNDLRDLFSDLNGKQTVDLAIEGNLISGGRFHADMTIDVVAQGGQLAATLSPNPPSDATTLSFTTREPGPLRVRVFDVHGRLVRTALDDPDGGAGAHAVRIDGRAADGTRLPSGVYFYRIEAGEGIATGRFALLR